MFTSLDRRSCIRLLWRSDLSFLLSKFAGARAYVYHLTAPDNLVRICETGLMESAASLLRAAERQELICERRREHVALRIGAQALWLRDQKPLHEANIGFEGGWTFGDLVEALNHLVFFWPGSGAGPNEYGLRHFERYASEEPVVIRVPTADLLRVNGDVTPLFCAYNSGSPRYTNGRASPRGPSTFASADRFAWGYGRVVELTFAAPLRLPSTTEYGFRPDGPWRVLL